MRSAMPKVLHQIAGRSMLRHVLSAILEAGADAVAVVIGPDRPDVVSEAARACPQAEIFIQHERRGTAHAVLAARAAIARGFDDVLVVFADTPLVLAQTFSQMRAALAAGAGVVALAFEAQDPDGYGRMILAGESLTAITEHKDASPAERAIKLCNAGLMALEGGGALGILERIGHHNQQQEYYLTDAVAIAHGLGVATRAQLADETEVLGVNDRVQLSRAEALAQARLRERAMRAGVTLIDPASTFLSQDTKLGRDIIIEPSVVIGAGVEIADGAFIHAFSHLEGAYVGPGASVGPFARLRPGARLGSQAKVGNFVEIKAADLGTGAKVSHLSYIGDATIGPDANIGAGVITCNYDGFGKHRTIVGAGAFVGSNSSLVAPVTIGDGAYVGSGSAITENVAADSLAVARGRQVAKPGWAMAFRERMRLLPKRR